MNESHIFSRESVLLRDGCSVKTHHFFKNVLGGWRGEFGFITRVVIEKEFGRKNLEVNWTNPVSITSKGTS